MGYSLAFSLPRSSFVALLCGRLGCWLLFERSESCNDKWPTIERVNYNDHSQIQNPWKRLQKLSKHQQKQSNAYKTPKTRSNNSCLKGFDDVPRNWFRKKHGQDSKWEHFARVHHHANEGTRYTTYFVEDKSNASFFPWVTEKLGCGAGHKVHNLLWWRRPKFKTSAFWISVQKK